MSGAQSNHVCAEMNIQLMLHVDDVLFVGQVLGRTVFAKVEGAFQRKCISLEGEGSSISFLKRKLVKVDHGLALVPGINIDKLVENFESSFGQVRVQHVACDSSIQLSMCLQT